MTLGKLGSASVGIMLVASCVAPAAAQVRTTTRTHAPAPAPAPVAKAKAAPHDATGADAVTLRDGKVALGQLIEPAPRGVALVVVRRAWAEANLPDWSARWTKAEGDGPGVAGIRRRDRLIVWKRDRMAGTGDRLDAWLDREINKGPGGEAASPLMVVRLPRSDIKTIDRRGMVAARALRLGWLLGFKDVETMPLADLRDALSGRGMIPEGDEPIALDTLLPQGLEPEAQWSIRKAATEVRSDPGLKFIRFGGTILPEGAGLGRPDPTAAASLLSGTIKDLLGNNDPDPIGATLRQAAARGRSGVLVTSLDMAPDMGSVTVEATLFVRQGDGRWARGLWRNAVVRAAGRNGGAAAAIADDPQVKSIFGMFDSIGLGAGSDEMKRKALAIGAMTQRASGLARSTMTKELAAIALPVDEAPASEAPKPKPAAP